MNKVNKRVHKIRKQAKYSQAEIGKVLNLKTSTYSQKEREGKFSGEELVILADFFKIDVREFLYDDIPKIEPIVIIPEECYLLNRREAELLTLYRNLSIPKQKELFAFAYNIFKNK